VAVKTVAAAVVGAAVVVGGVVLATREPPPLVNSMSAVCLQADGGPPVPCPGVKR
jgi:hypothetical protein